MDEMYSNFYDFQFQTNGRSLNPNRDNQRHSIHTLSAQNSHFRCRSWKLVRMARENSAPRKADKGHTQTPPTNIKTRAAKQTYIKQNTNNILLVKCGL